MPYLASAASNYKAAESPTPLRNRLIEIIDEVRKEEGIDPDSYQLIFQLE